MTDVQNNQTSSSEFYRFQICLGKMKNENEFQRSKSVGMAYLKNGQNMYTIKLWTLTNEKYYLIPSKEDPSKFLIFSREPNKKDQTRSKYFWNIVGNGKALSTQGIVQLDFDLLHCSLYLNLFPEASTKTAHLNDPENFNEAA